MSSRVVRRLVGALLIAGLTLVAGCDLKFGDNRADDDEPQLIAFEAPGFTIDLPGTPEETSQTVPSAAGDIAVVVYTVSSGESAVAVAVTTVPDGVPLDLDGAVNGAASNIGGTVLSSDSVTVDGDEGRDGRIGVQQDGAFATTFFHIVASGQRLVQVQQVVKGEAVTTPPKNYEAIVASLVLN